jgi:hypothetical protein
VISVKLQTAGSNQTMFIYAPLCNSYCTAQQSVLHTGHRTRATIGRQLNANNSPDVNNQTLKEFTMSDAFTRQVQDFTRQAQEMFSAGKDAKIPENMSAFAEDAVAKSREVYNKVAAATKDQAKVVEDVMLTAQDGAK